MSGVLSFIKVHALFSLASPLSRADASYLHCLLIGVCNWTCSVIIAAIGWAALHGAIASVISEKLKQVECKVIVVNDAMTMTDSCLEQWTAFDS